ncbi:MAG: choice-of-anchor tandem repeat GloVer-containing protein, partial [Candidatus Korobacteraceae bacterium]
MKLKTLVYLTLIALIGLLNTAAHAQTFSVIHAFADGAGVLPYSGVTIRAGVLYGTTMCTQYCSYNGTVYQMVPVGSNWHFALISLFSAGGELPEARVVFGPDGHLYGTTVLGPPKQHGFVFNLTPLVSICKTANCFWTEKVLYQFMDAPDGNEPGAGDLIWDPAGNIYGTTVYGGISDLGVVYQMTKSGNGWTETPIYSFTGPDGNFPFAGVILDSNGNLFGTTEEGGLYGFGTVFELTYNINSGWTETVLYNFQNLSDGQGPSAGLVGDSAGNLYGATSDGGSGGGGAVFELSPAGNSWAFTLLYSFTGQQGMYCGPTRSLTLNSGNLYGTTDCDGVNNLGSVFKLTKTKNGWQYTSLHDFTGGSDGRNLFSNVTFDTDGNLYGTAVGGGDLTCHPPLGCGTVWMI